jgi:hypothetical protein
MVIDISKSKAVFICREYGAGRIWGIQKLNRHFSVYCYWFSIGATW